MTAGSDGATSNDFARQAGAMSLDLLHAIQAKHGGHAAISAALAMALMGLGFIRDATGDSGAEVAAAMMSGAVANRQDRVVPTKEAR